MHDFARFKLHETHTILCGNKKTEEFNLCKKCALSSLSLIAIKKKQPFKKRETLYDS